MALKSNAKKHKPKIDAENDAVRPKTEPCFKFNVPVSLTGCMGMDIVSIIMGMGENVKKVRVSITALQNIEYPDYSTEVKLVYELWGNNLNPENLNKAIEQNTKRYVSENSTHKKNQTLTHRVVIYNE
ncbi:MAG TPA: hypothetical protein DDY04_07125 [Bacteroidales bacterium]|nr:hypothetical protein [Bacteroidales bacterium]